MAVETLVDMHTIQEILNDALMVVKNLDGAGITDASMANRQAEAQYNRELLNLADSLQLASSLVRNEYWTAKGKGLMSYEL